MKKLIFIMLFMVSCATLKITNRVEIVDKSDGEKFICENTTQNKNFQSFIKCIIEKNGQKYNCSIDIRKENKDFDIEQDCIIQIETKDNF
jgi:hypothetical protein